MREINNALKGFAKLRKKTGASVEDIQKRLLTEYDIKVAVKTIYGWECGRVQPPINTFISLCKIYKIKDIYKFVDFTEKYVDQSIKEEKLINNYREMVELQPAIDKLLSL